MGLLVYKTAWREPKRGAEGNIKLIIIALNGVKGEGCSSGVIAILCVLRLLDGGFANAIVVAFFLRGVVGPVGLRGRGGGRSECRGDGSHVFCGGLACDSGPICDGFRDGLVCDGRFLAESRSAPAQRGGRRPVQVASALA